MCRRRPSAQILAVGPAAGSRSEAGALASFVCTIPHLPPPLTTISNKSASLDLELEQRHYPCISGTGIQKRRVEEHRRNEEAQLFPFFLYLLLFFLETILFLLLFFLNAESVGPVHQHLAAQQTSCGLTDVVK
jgi:hypothetical protein